MPVYMVLHALYIFSLSLDLATFRFRSMSLCRCFAGRSLQRRRPARPRLSLKFRVVGLRARGLGFRSVGLSVPGFVQDLGSEHSGS